jgi:hypothetical protein
MQYNLIYCKKYVSLFVSVMDYKDSLPSNLKRSYQKRYLECEASKLQSWKWQSSAQLGWDLAVGKGILYILCMLGEGLVICPNKLPFSYLEKPNVINELKPYLSLKKQTLCLSDDDYRDLPYKFQWLQNVQSFKTYVEIE